MTRYIATFHTHLAALRSSRSLSGKGIAAQMTPVPRKPVSYTHLDVYKRQVGARRDGYFWYNCVSGETDAVLELDAK